MIIRRGPALEVVSHGTRDLPVEIPNRKKEIQRVVARLEALLVEHIESAKRLKVVLGAEDFRSVIKALEAEADGLNPESHLACPDEIRGYVLRSLWEELVEEPSNILFQSTTAAGTTLYQAMPCEFWKECLAELRSRLRL